MPFFPVSLSIAAGATVDLLNTTSGIVTPWKYNRAPYKGILEVMCRSVGAPATPLNQRMTVGSDEVVQQGLLGAGGTAQNLPSRLNCEPITVEVDQGDVISYIVNNPGAGAIEVDATFELTRAK